MLSSALMSQSSECGFDQVFNSVKESNSAFQKKSQVYEKAYQEFMHSEQRKSHKGDEFLYLPLVVHVIHSGEDLGSAANPSDETILDEIVYTNNIFRQFDMEQEFNNPNYGLDTEISFCLAFKDNDGQPAPSVLRYDKRLLSPESNSFYLEKLYRDKNKFINIVILDVEGYCGVYFPQDDVIHISNKCMIQSGTMAHELGHYLSLQHTFFPEGECNNSSCHIQGDFVCDTPPQLSSELLTQEKFENQPCTYPGDSCHSDEDDMSDINPYRSLSLGGLGGQPDANNNIMGYGGSCRATFTQGQAQRMQFNLTEFRDELWATSIECEQPNTTLHDASIDNVQMNIYEECSQKGAIEFELLNSGSANLQEVDLFLYRNNILVDSIEWRGNLKSGEKEVLYIENVETVFGENLFFVELKRPNSSVDYNTFRNTSFFRFSTLETSFNFFGNSSLLISEIDTVSIGINILDPNNEFNFIWRRANGFIDDLRRYEPTLNVTQPDVYYLNIYSKDYACEWISEFAVNQHEKNALNISVNSFRLPYLDCYSNNIELSASINSELSHNAYKEWYSRTGFLSTTNRLSVDSAGDYRVRFVDDESNIDFFSDWFTVYDLRRPPKVHVIVKDEITCENTSVLIDGGQSDYLPGRYMYRWTYLKGDKVLVENDTTLRILVSKPGFYSLEVIDKVTRCSNIAELEVKASSDMPIVNIRKQLIFPDTLQLNTDGSSEGDSFSFEWSTVAGEIFADENTLNPIVKSMGTYILEITNNDSGCKQSEELSFLPKHYISLSTNCSQISPIPSKLLKLEFINANIFSSQSYVTIWTLPDGTESKDNFVLTRLPGLYEVKYFNNIDTIRDSIILYPEMFENPQIKNVPLMDSISCANEVTFLSAEDSDFGENDVFIWRDSFDNILGDDLNQEIIGSGVFSLEIINPLSLCVDKVFTEIILRNYITALAGDDKEITCDNTEISLGENVDQDDLVFRWSLLPNTDSVLLGNSSAISIDDGGLYQLEMYNSLNNCYSYDTIEVEDLRFDYNLQIEPDNIIESCESINANLFIRNIEDYYGYDLYWTLPDGSEMERLILPVYEVGEYTLHVKSIYTGCSYSEIYDSHSLLQLDQINLLESDLMAEPTGGTPPYTYLWSTAVTNQLLQDPIFREHYAVTVTDANGCTVSQEIQYLQPPNNESVILMPNPTSDNIQIFIQSGDPIEEIKIYNAIGQCVKTIQDYQSLDWIDVSQFSSGVYIAVLSGKSLNYTTKFVKE